MVKWKSAQFMHDSCIATVHIMYSIVLNIMQSCQWYAHRYWGSPGGEAKLMDGICTTETHQDVQSP